MNHHEPVMALHHRPQSLRPFLLLTKTFGHSVVMEPLLVAPHPTPPIYCNQKKTKKIRKPTTGPLDSGPNTGMSNERPCPRNECLQLRIAVLGPQLDQQQVASPETRQPGGRRRADA